MDRLSYRYHRCFAIYNRNLLTLSAPNDVDLRFAVFLLWVKRRRSTSKYLNFPPYDVIGIKLKSMISATNTAVSVRWSNLICTERGEPQLSIYSMKKSFTLQLRDLLVCHLKKIGLGCQVALYENFSSFDCAKTNCFHKNRLVHVMGTGRFDG
jgi:hypothetical protein